MCVIIAMEEKVPSLEIMELCEKKNSHGGGISWIDNGKVHWKKGIKAKEIHEIAIEFGPPCIAHFRISTVGGTPKTLCHPFPIVKTSDDFLEGSGDSVLFHNGHWTDWQKFCMNLVVNKNAVFGEGDWSDSKALAWVTAHSNHSFMHFLERQRVAIQTPKARIYYGSWEKKDDVWYSNLNWDTPKHDLSKYWKEQGYQYGYNDKGEFLYGDLDKACEEAVAIDDKNEKTGWCK